MKKALLSGFLISTLLFLGGCEGPYIPVSNPHSPETFGSPVVLLDEDLKDDVAVDVIHFGPNPNHYLTVQANIRNRTDGDLELQAQTLFFDATGTVLNSEPGNQTAWTNLQLTANETMPYTSQSLSTAATRCTVRIRYLHRNRD